MSTVGRRGILLLGIGCLLGAALAFTGRAPASLVFVSVSIPAAIALLVAGVLGITSVLTRVRVVAAIGGALLVLAALIQLLQLAEPGGLIAGDGSTMALLGGLGIGLMAVGIGDRPTIPTPERR